MEWEGDWKKINNTIKKFKEENKRRITLNDIVMKNTGPQHYDIYLSGVKISEVYKTESGWVRGGTYYRTRKEALEWFLRAVN